MVITRPANVVCEGYELLQVNCSVHRGGWQNPPWMENPPSWMENFSVQAMVEPPQMENPPGWRMHPLGMENPPRWRTPPGWRS